MTSERHALQVWALLVCAARDRRTYTYGDIAETLGWRKEVDGLRVVGPLNLVAEYCSAHGFPPLHVLVVNAKSGQPGEGFDQYIDIDEQREAVFRFRWFEVEPYTA